MTNRSRSNSGIRRPQGKCIFCGKAGGLSKEHLFANWLSDLFPRTADDTHTLATVISWEPKPTFAQQIKQGHSGSRKLRKVCAGCNSGWISLIDAAARRAAPSLIRGGSVVVTSETQRSLAAWFVKIAIVADSNRPDRSVVLQNDRDWLRNQSLPPLLWEVWIGSYRGTVWRDLAIFQHGGRLDLTEVTGPHKLAGYVTTTTLGLGNMLALVIGSENPQIDVSIGTAALSLRRIWPSRDLFHWPLNHTLTDNEAGGIAYILRSAVAHPRIPITP